jgi:ATP-dependent DNA ligase
LTLDGEAVVAGADGVAVFDALHRRGHVTDAILQAFDLLELDGEDLRPVPLIQRKPRLSRVRAAELGAARLSVPVLPSPFPMSHHRRAGRILDLDPVPRRRGQSL